MTIETMTPSQRRQAREDLRDAISDLNEDIACKLAELADVKAELEALREQRAWRRDALEALRAAK